MPINYISVLLLLITINAYSNNIGEATNIEASYIVDMQSVFDGEKEGTPIIGNFVLSTDIDLDKLYNFEKTNFFTSLMIMHGRSPQTYVDDLQTTSGIDGGGIDSIYLYESYFQRSFFNDKLSVLFGLYDLSGEFNINAPATYFIHSSLGTSAALGTSGRNGPTIFPMSALALRLSYDLSEYFYIKFALTDGVPGDIKNPYHNEISINDDDGDFELLELVYHQEDHYKFGLGFWRYSKKLDDLKEVDSSGDPVKKRSQGAYFISDYQFSNWFHPFFRYDFANKNVQEISSNIVFGFISQSPWDSESTFGIHTSIAYLSEKYYEDNNLESKETAYEINYTYSPSDLFTIIPNYQEVHHPSGRKDLDRVKIFGLRLKAEI